MMLYIDSVPSRRSTRDNDQQVIDAYHSDLRSTRGQPVDIPVDTKTGGRHYAYIPAA